MESRTLIDRGERMKQAAIVIAVLGMCVASVGQDKPAAQAPPAGQAAGQATAEPQGKRPPKVNSQEEYAAYKAAIAITDAAAQEKAAEDFATKYPQSELRPLIYKSVMQRYQAANNGDKMIEMARKVLSIDGDDPEALVAVAQVDAEQTRDTDLDKDQKYAEAKKDAERALVTVDTDVPTTGYPPDQLAKYKNFIRSQAYFVLGTVSFKGSNWADAEVNLRKSIDALPDSPDVVCVYRLALALDFQNKIPDALKVVQQAVDLTKDNPDSPPGKAARQEQQRLLTYSKGAGPAQSGTPPKN
jgi:tetratricopeptide (TPR) repeat protein